MKEKVLHVFTPTNTGYYSSKFAMSKQNAVITFIVEQLKNKRGPEYQLWQYETPETFIVDAREHAAETAVNGGVINGQDCPPADYLIMIDDDMILPPDTIVKLLAHNKPIVAPLFHHRRAPFKAVMMNYANGSGKMEYVPTEPKKPLQEVDAVGFGVVCIDVNRVLRKVNRPFFWMEPKYGEDVYFCHKAKQEAKARIFVDTTIDVAHIGDPMIVNRATATDLRRQIKEAEDVEA